MPRPTVAHIPPPSSISRSHHGPPKKASIGQQIPKWFKNPWPSYRTASVWDFYEAYQRGAAIAPSLSHPLDEELSENQESQQGAYDYQSLEQTTSTSSSKRLVHVRPEFSKVDVGDDRDDWRDPPVEVVEPKWGDGSDQQERVTWLGHAGVLVQIPWKEDKAGCRRDGMCNILFDPIFSYRCSPTQYAGPARYMDSPCSVAYLPEIHACFISHDHYDHLDYYTIMDLWKYHVATIHFFVPMGLKGWFTSSGIPSHRVTELDWWHESLLRFSNSPDNNYDPHYPPIDVDGASEGVSIDPTAALTLKIAFTPAQHRSGRGVFDHMTTLWGSWCVGVVDESDSHRALERGMKDWAGFKVYFGGDTGYRYATAPEQDDSHICPAFQQIADYYGPFSLALLPVSTGSSLPFLRSVLSLSIDQYILTSALHCSPADSLSIHRVIKSKRTLGIHWGTFCDADEARGTRVDFGRCRRAAGVGKDWISAGRDTGDNGTFVVCDIGDTLVIPPSDDVKQ